MPAPTRDEYFLIYRSNLDAPDLSIQFAHLHSRPLPYSLGHDVPSDWADKADSDPVLGIYKACGCWTHDERAILHNVARQIRGTWLDIGAATGITTAHLARDVDRVIAIEPMFSLPEFYSRFAANVSIQLTAGRVMPWAGRSDQYFYVWDGAGGRTFDGVVVDGDHNHPVPMNDAIGAWCRLKDRAVVLFHDFRGAPVWDAAKWLVDQGMRFKVYFTPHMVCLCWRGEFAPPEHQRDTSVDWGRVAALPEWAR